eukprot:4630379-Karenia_brevis.AAC.1
MCIRDRHYKIWTNMSTKAWRVRKNGQSVDKQFKWNKAGMTRRTAWKALVEYIESGSEMSH